MDQRSDQIVEHIENQRSELGRNLDELENRVRVSTDWRIQFERHPAAMMGAALGGGLLLGVLIRGATSGRRRSSSSYTDAWGEESIGVSSSKSIKRSSPGASLQRHRAGETIENIKGALIGYGAAQLKNLLVGTLPGFERHYNETAQSNLASASSYGTPGYGSSGTYGSPSSGGAGQQGSGFGPSSSNSPRESNPSL